VIGVNRLRLFRSVAIAMLAIAVFGPNPASAQRLTLDNGFQSPSGNIHCQFFDADAALRCDLREIVNRPLPRPRDCENDWGQAFEVFARKNETGPICYGDTVMDERLPVLAYGQRWQRGDFVCHSERSGVSCLNSAGAGFELSRSAQTVLRGRPDGGRIGSDRSSPANPAGKSIGGRIN
jgi:hypothetical protein